MLILLQGMNLLVVDENEILVTVGDGQCNITTRTNNEISCIPPQSASGTLNNIIVVSVYIYPSLAVKMYEANQKQGYK